MHRRIRCAPFYPFLIAGVVIAAPVARAQDSSGVLRQPPSYDLSILTPLPGPAPRINGPLVYGCRPSHPFLYRVPCTGERPIEFSAAGLPGSLRLDRTTGIVTGA